MPPGTITSLRAQEHDSQRVNVFVDGEFAIGVSLNTLTREGLYVGKALDSAAWQRLEASEQHDKALQHALRYLDTRPRSVAELRERLRRARFLREAIDSALARLVELALVDDDAFARFWVEIRQACRPRGAGALRDELRRKGVDRAIIEAALDDPLTGDEAGRAMTLARAALPKYAGAVDRVAFARRMGGYLQRRGFGFEIVRPIVEQLWGELGRSAGDEEP